MADNKNPGDAHEADLFNHFEREYKNPSASPVGEDANIDRAQAATRNGPLGSSDLRSAETAAANNTKGAKADASVADQENAAADRYRDLYRQHRQQSKENRAKGGKRGLFIGLGAGGGLLSVVAGFSFLLPLKLPAIMDNIIDIAGHRIEHVVERRVERILFRYILQGSRAALANGTGVATGNPIGDLFANIHESHFEDRLKNGKYKLSFEPGPNKTVRLVQDGKALGDVRTPDDIVKILERSANGESLTRADIRRIVHSEVPFYRFYKRIQLADWIRNKYNVKYFGAREKQPAQTDEEYQKQVIEERLSANEQVATENLEKTITCIASAGDDCGTDVKNPAAEEFKNEATKALTDNDARSKLAGEVVEKGVKTVAEEVGKKGAGVLASRISVVLLTTLGVGASIPFVGEIDMAARAVHGLGQAVDNGKLQQLHAEAVGRASAVVAIGAASMADGTKAGIPPIAAVGAAASQFDNAETSLAYNVANYGEARGEDIGPLEKVQENTPPGAFTSFAIGAFDTVGKVLRIPFEAWYYTVSQVFDLASEPLGDLTAWVVKNIPGINTLMDQIVPYMNQIFEGLMKLVGMYIDPLAVGAAFYSYVMQGFLVIFNDYGKELGMMKLSADQRTAMDSDIRSERIADLQDTPLTERLFSLSNSDSLASALLAGVPSTGISNPIGTLAGMGLNLVGRAPSNLASITSTKAYAAGITVEDVFGKDAYGATESQLDADVDPALFEHDVACPANDPNKLNTCSIDKSLMKPISCAFVQCPELSGQPAVDTTDISVSGNVQELAAKILALSPSKIRFDAADEGTDGAKQDLIRASHGTQTHCGATHVSLDPALLNLIYNLAQKYSFLITAMVSDHTEGNGCTAGFHPRGKAVDIDLVDGNNAITDETRNFYRQFAIDASALMTSGGRIGQSSCLGTLPLKNNVKQFDDTCTHIHLDVP